MLWRWSGIFWIDLRIYVLYKYMLLYRYGLDNQRTLDKLGAFKTFLRLCYSTVMVGHMTMLT
jgi:hypothetical protein